MRLERITTGVPGLDQILGGGLLKAGVYLVQGAAGAGKTILANQIAFSRIAAGEKVAYVTLLAESHARMMQHMELFSFYKADAIPSAMHYISAFDGACEGRLGRCGNRARRRNAPAQSRSARTRRIGDRERLHPGRLRT